MHKEKVDEVAVKVLEQQGYDKAWVQARLARIADFQINRFIKMIGGRPHYDFSKATEEDWYCISEYTADAVIRDSDIDVYPCEKIKIKSNCKMKALELMGKTVGAFTDKVEHSGGVTIHFEDDFENDD